jgi:uncharacterized protein YneF (UPF0154 family)
METTMTNQTKTIIALIMIFICGLVLGVGGTLLVEKRVIKRVLENPERSRTMIMARMSRQLNLDADQKTAIMAIMRDQYRELARIRLEAGPDVERVLTDAHDRIIEQLDENQRERFNTTWNKFYGKFHRGYYSGTDKSTE